MTLKGDCDTPGAAMDIVFTGDYAHEKNHGSGLLVLDISTPTSPSFAGSYNTLPNGNLGLKVIQIANINPFPFMDGSHIYGLNLLWRATLICSEDGVYPTCSSPEIALDGIVSVLIYRFVAKVAESGVRLFWDITTDEEIRGFEIYRRIEGQQVKEKVNQTGLIPPHVRTYVDATIRQGKPYWYTLSIVKNDGKEIRPHPVKVLPKFQTSE